MEMQLFQFDVSQSRSTDIYHTYTTLDLSSPPIFTDPLIPPDHQWPTFDSISLYKSPESATSSCYSSPSLSGDGVLAPDVQRCFPSNAMLASIPIPFSRTSSRNRSPNHVPRPRNAFMLFRSAFAAAQKISANIEHDSRHITRIIAHCWNRLPECEKQVWRDKAAAEKAMHAVRYPNYRFTPVNRAQKPIKRNVRRNGAEDKKRCEQVAELLLAGKQGYELENAVKQISTTSNGAEDVCGRRSGAYPTERDLAVNTVQGWPSSKEESEERDIQPFRSPLLPPTKTSTATIPNIQRSEVHLDTVRVSQTFPARDHSLQASFEYHCASFDSTQPITTSQTYPSIYHGHCVPAPISPKTLYFSENTYSPFPEYIDQNTHELSAPDFSHFSWDNSASIPPHCVPFSGFN